MHLRSDVQYCISSTLFCKQIIVGIAEQNSYVKFDEKYIETIIRLVNFLERESNEEAYEVLSDEDKQIVALFDSYGYFDNGRPIKAAFNEYEKLGNKIFSMNFKNFPRLECKNINFLIGVIILISLSCIIFSALNNSFFTHNIDIFSMSVFEIIFCLTILPILVTSTHEFGHYIMSQLTGVGSKNLSVGLLLLYPIILVRYSGLHLYPTRKKILIELAGIFFNLMGMTLGIFFKKLGLSSVILDFWILAHWSGILANIGIIGLKDGYFFITTITGFLNLRMKGYMNLKKIFVKNSEENVDKKGVVMAYILTCSFILSLVASVVQLTKYANVFGLPGYVSWIVCTIFCSVFMANFALKIRNI